MVVSTFDFIILSRNRVRVVVISTLYHAKVKRCYTTIYIMSHQTCTTPADDRVGRVGYV